MTDISKPSFSKTATGYSLDFKTENIKVVMEAVSQDGKGEISVFYANGKDNRMLLPRSQTNLLSITTLSGLAKRLKQHKDIEWDSLLSYVSHLVVSAIREGEPLVDIGVPPASTKLDYLLRPILVENEPTTIYGPGGYGKSLLSDLIAVLVQYNYVFMDWIPNSGNVMILDWEAGANIHQRYIDAIKVGLGITGNEQILYRYCESDMTSILEIVQRDIEAHNIKLVIVDSQMAASAHGRPGTDSAQIAGMYYNALRALRTTTLTIDHTTKQGMRDDDSTTPYGSVVKYNRSRSQFELKHAQEAGDDFMELSLVHKKFNLGRRLKPIGIRIDFANNGDELKEITFTEIDVVDHPTLQKDVPLRERILRCLVLGKATPEYLEESIPGSNLNNIRVTLTRLKKSNQVVSLGANEWGLSARNE